MATVENTIARLEAKLKQAKAKKQQIEARKRASETKEERANDTRRKILIGAAVLRKIETNKWSEKELNEMMDDFLKNQKDRILFDFPQI